MKRYEQMGRSANARKYLERGKTGFDNLTDLTILEIRFVSFIHHREQRAMELHLPHLDES